MAILPRLEQFKNKILEILDVKLDRAFGMDISDGSIEILELRVFLRFSIVTHGRIILKKGIVEDGAILDADALKANIRELLGKVDPKKISTNKVVLSLPESKVFIHFFTLDASLKRDKLKQAVLNEASKIIPLAHEDTYWDFETKTSFIRGKNSVVYAGAPKKIVDDYLTVCSDIGLEVVALDMESASAGRALLAQNKKTNVILDCGARTTDISVFDRNGVLNLSVAVPIAGTHITKAVAEKLRVPYEEAEEMKKKWGIKEDSQNPVAETVKKEFERICAEIKNAFVYYEEQHGEKIEEAYLIGGTSLLFGIGAYFQNSLGVPIRTVTHFKTIKGSELLNDTLHPVFFTNVIGLAMRGASNKFRGINLVREAMVLKAKARVGFDLFGSGYLKKTTIIRMLLNNKIFVITSLVLSIILLIFVFYEKIYLPFSQIANIKDYSAVAFPSPTPSEVPDITLSETPNQNSNAIPELAPEIKRIISVMIIATPTGFLNLRDGPGETFNKIGKVLPNETFGLVEERAGWYKIKANENTEGWITAKYAIKLE